MEFLMNKLLTAPIFAKIRHKKEARFVLAVNCIYGVILLIQSH